MTLAISQIAAYPVKSLAGLYPLQAELTRTGLKHDREWMVVDQNGTFLTQRQHPKMALIRAEPSDSALRLTVPGREPLEVPILEVGTGRTVQVWNDTCEAVDQGDPAAVLLSNFIGRECRLVRMRPGFDRALGAKYRVSPETGVGFADSAPLLLISQASLDDLNSRLDTSVEMNRFRTNLVVSGGSPYQEDGWKRIRIGKGVFHIAAPCIRCQIPKVDQATGTKGIEPLETLERYRATPKGPRFGVKVAHEALTRIRVGDAVEVLE